MADGGPKESSGAGSALRTELQGTGGRRVLEEGMMQIPPTLHCRG